MSKSAARPERQGKVRRLRLIAVGILVVYGEEDVKNRFFRKVDGMVWDMMTGKLGYQQQDGIITLELNMKTHTLRHLLSKYNLGANNAST